MHAHWNEYGRTVTQESGVFFAPWWEDRNVDVDSRRKQQKRIVDSFPFELAVTERAYTFLVSAHGEKTFNHCLFSGGTLSTLLAPHVAEYCDR